MNPVEARYEEGSLRLTSPLPLRPGERVCLIVMRLPDPGRWNLDRLSRHGQDEDLALAQAGITDWVDMLDVVDAALGMARMDDSNSDMPGCPSPQ